MKQAILMHKHWCGGAPKAALNTCRLLVDTRKSYTTWACRAHLFTASPVPTHSPGSQLATPRAPVQKQTASSGKQPGQLEKHLRASWDMAVAPKHVAEWNKDKHLRNPGCLILSHNHILRDV